MSLHTALERFRRRQASLFSSTCLITRPSGAEAELDEESGDLTPAEADEIYEGPCLVRPAELVGSDLEAGERELRSTRRRLKLPVNTPIQMNDQVLMLTSKYDAGLVGKSYRITDVLEDDWQIARVALIEENPTDVE